MSSRIVLCPHSGFLELVDYTTSSVGMLVDQCTRFGTCEPACTRACAQLFDLRERLAARNVGDVTRLDITPAPAK